MKPEKDEAAVGYTTIRASVTPDEHRAIKWTCDHTFGGATINDFVRSAVDAHLTKNVGKSLAELAKSASELGKYVQGELF